MATEPELWKNLRTPATTDRHIYAIDVSDGRRIAISTETIADAIKREIPEIVSTFRGENRLKWFAAKAIADMMMSMAGIPIEPEAFKEHGPVEYMLFFFVEVLEARMRGLEVELVSDTSLAKSESKFEEVFSDSNDVSWYSPWTPETILGTDTPSDLSLAQSKESEDMPLDSAKDTPSESPTRPGRSPRKDTP